MSWHDVNEWTGKTLLKNWWDKVRDNLVFLKTGIEEEAQARETADGQIENTIGGMEGLNTADKSTIVNAVNEVRGNALTAFHYKGCEHITEIAYRIASQYILYVPSPGDIWLIRRDWEKKTGGGFGHIEPAHSEVDSDAYKDTATVSGDTLMATGTYTAGKTGYYEGGSTGSWWKTYWIEGYEFIVISDYIPSHTYYSVSEMDDITGKLSNLVTTDKSTLVSAINEVKEYSETEFKRLQYYGDADIIPSDDEDFTWTVYADSGVATVTRYTGSDTSVVIPYEHDGYPVIAIRDYAFCNCTGLTSITIPESVTYIGERAFEDCHSLTEITIPNGVTSIGKYVFLGCSGLTNISVSNGITSIGEHAFLSCTSLTSIIIPESVTSIDHDAFYNCTNLTSITIPDSVTSIGNSAFEDCHKLTIICPQGSYAETYAKANDIPYMYDIAEPVDLSGYYNKTAVDSKIAVEASAREAADLTKSDKTTITSSADTSGTLTPANNTEVRYGAVTSLELTLPQSIPNDYISSVVFTSGQNSVNLTYPDTVQMTGEDCIDGIFVPAGGKRYTVILSYDGVYVSGVVGGVSI